VRARQAVERLAREVPPGRILLRRREAAELLGMSLRSFERSVQPYVAMVVVGQLKLVRPSELERWVEKNSRAPF
jgi:hypothetical protein